MSPIIIPLQTDVNRDIPASVTFAGNKFDTNASVTFTTAASGVSYISGNLIGLVGGASGTICSLFVQSSNLKLSAFQASGDVDSSFYLSVNNSNVFRFDTNITSLNVAYQLPVSINLNLGDTVRLYVVNLSSDTSDYTGCIMGSF